MAITNDHILRISRNLGVTAEEGLRTGRYEIAETGATKIVDDLISQITAMDGGDQSNPVYISDDLRRTYEAYARDFMAVVKERFPGGVVPVLLLKANEFGAPVPIDIHNLRAIEGIQALSRRFPNTPSITFDPLDGRRFGYWTFLRQLGAPVGTQPWGEAARTFFGLLAANLWRAGISLWGRQPTSLITYTVNCTNHGYVLDCWPQFYYSPKRFGSKKTHPVTAGIKPNHYKFQGWLNGTVTIDPGVHPASAGKTSTILGAF